MKKSWGNTIFENQGGDFNMKKLSLGLLSLVTAFSLVGCGSNQSNKTSSSTPQPTETTKLVVGASSTPHTEILEQTIPLLKKEGIELEIVTFQDYVLPNRTLTEGELDANYFQHIPYLESYNADNGTDIVNAGGIHIEPIGIYSKNYKSLDELPEGATVIMSSRVSSPALQAMMLTYGDAEPSNAIASFIGFNPPSNAKFVLIKTTSPSPEL